MSVTAVDYTYRYPFASQLGLGTDGDLEFSLATSSRTLDHPHFFSGSVLQPRQFAQMLLVLSDIVRTHFFLPQNPLMDPVVTSSPNMLRLEGFSGCCGVYARVDLQSNAFDGQLLEPGTTNVDFNDPMRGALNRIQDSNRVQLNVGREGVELETGKEKIIEKKVKLPIRWIKGFSEVQAYLPRLQPRMEVPGSEALRFFRGLSRTGGPKQKTWVVQTGNSIRLSQRAGRGAVAFLGTHRLRVMAPLFKLKGSLRVYDDIDTGVSAWEYRADCARMLVLLSPEVHRGFSGEGQLLGELSGNKWQDVLDSIQSQLSTELSIDANKVADHLLTDRASVNAALAVLGSRGLAGYDLNNETYFYRELPFNLNEVEKLQPRLKAARRLIEKDGVKVTRTFKNKETETEYDVSVVGTDVNHLVRLRHDGDRCSCPWFSKYQGQRGPCKHILAAHIHVEGEPSPQ